VLTRNGYTPVLASNGAEALIALESDNYGLILMDVEMPVIDGIETTRRIRQDSRWSKLPIVAMTARAMEGDEQACIEVGMNGFLTKPITASHLLSVVQNYADATQSSATAS
jgi:CheY-like chemotaxis protein